MFSPTTFLRCIVFVVLTSASLHAAGDSGKPKSPLGEQMEAMSKGLRQLGKQIADPSKHDSSLEIITGAVQNAEKAKTLIPTKAKEVPEADREKFVSDFQTKMDELIADLHKVEAAIRDGKNEEARTLLTQLRTLKREGHEKFSSEEEN